MQRNCSLKFALFSVVHIEYLKIILIKLLNGFFEQEKLDAVICSITGIEPGILQRSEGSYSEARIPAWQARISHQLKWGKSRL